LKSKNKKAVSSVLLVAAVLLIGVVVVFSILFFQVRREETRIRAPGELAPVEDLVLMCLDEASERTFITLGQRGGLIFPSEAMFDPSKPTEGNALAISDEDFVAYWHFMYSNNYCTSDCSFGSMAKPLDELKEDIEEYLSYSLVSCVLERWNLGDDFRMTIKNVPETEVFFVNRQIRVKAMFPLEVAVRADNTLRQLSDFETVVDLDFKEVYETAQKLAGYQIRTRSLEQAMLNLIWMYSDVDSAALPPQYHVSLFEFSPTYWDADYVKSFMKALMASYLNQVTVKDSKNFRSPELPETEKTVMQGSLVWDLDGRGSPVRNYEIDFFYNPAWEPFVSFYPMEGFLMPETARIDTNPLMILTGIAGLVKYKFNYQVSFPVLVHIKDPSAFGGDGYTFRLALEANIRNNDVLEQDGGISISARTGSVLCNKNHWAGSYEFAVQDENSEPLGGVVLFASGIGESCELGVTDSSGRIVTTLPAESILTIEGLKQGYFVEPSTANTKVARYRHTLRAFPEKSINVNARKFVFSSRDIKNKDFSAGTIENIQNDETLLLIMQNAANEQYVFTLSAEEGEEASGEALLVPGEYKVFAIVVHERSFVIPEACKPNDLICLTKIDEISMERYPVSIFKLEDAGFFEITPEDLYSKSTIDVLIPSTELPQTHDQMQDLPGLQAWVTENAELFMPRFR